MTYLQFVRRRRSKGFTFVELLVSAILLSIGLMALVNVWAFTFWTSANTDDKVIAYSLGRQGLERVKMSGFTNAAEGSVMTYYDGNQTLMPSTTGARYSLTTSIVSDLVKSGTSGSAGAVPADNALRTITLTLKLISNNTSMYQTYTYLVRAGV